MTSLQLTGARRDGYHLIGGARFVFLLFILFSFCSPASATSVELGEISRLAKSGASQLALSLLSQNQPAFNEDAKQWLRWERIRVRILEEHGRWSELAAHIAAYPAGLPLEYREWSQLQQASALINAGEYAEARRLLRSLIWHSDALKTHSEQRFSQLRRLVMQSYLEQGRIRDAYAAMLRFHQDYGEQDSESMLLQAKVLLAAKRPGESYALLQNVAENGVVRALQSLARLREGGEAEVILKEARTAAVEAEDDRLRWFWFGVMAEAAQKLASHANLIIALERLLPLSSSVKVSSSERRLFVFTAEQLWDGYLAYATKIGNSEQLLIGDDAAWLSAAEKTDVRYPVRKRALYALLAQRGAKSEMREKAHQALLQLFFEMEEEGKILIHHLYLDSERYGEKQRLPQAVAYYLVDEAIKNAELGLASRLLQQLPQPPGGTERFVWQMRRAKVFLLAGDYAEADKLLGALMPNVAALSDEQRDQVVQLLFDMQAVNEHERAFALFSVMFEHVPAIKLRRELLFWMADSRKAQSMHAEAARLYLQSATLGDNNSMDPWAQTARYQAAKSLGEAGMDKDATYIYRQLLKITQSPERRSVLRHELRQLKLRGERG